MKTDTLTDELYDALDNCVKLLEPDCCLEDMVYRSKHQERMMAEARAVLKK